MIRIVIVDDHILIRKGIVNTLSMDPSIQILGEAASGTEAINLINQKKPNIVVLDMHLPDMTGLQIALWANEKLKDTRIIFHTGSKNIFLIRQMLLPNVYGILTKDNPEQLTYAIKDTFNGRRYLQPNLAYDLAVLSRKISDREFQVAYMLFEGKTISDIAKSLRLSTKTIQTHKMNARKKMKKINKIFHWRSHSQFYLNFSSSPLP